jgi:hypothetical protein
MNDVATAALWARRGLAASDDGASVRGLLADALWRSGERDEAREVLAAGLALDATSAPLLRLQRRFASEAR